MIRHYEVREVITADAATVTPATPLKYAADLLVKANVSGPTELLLMRNSYHMITIDRERRLLARRSAEFFSAIDNTVPVELESAA